MVSYSAPPCWCITISFQLNKVECVYMNICWRTPWGAVLGVTNKEPIEGMVSNNKEREREREREEQQQNKREMKHRAKYKTTKICRYYASRKPGRSCSRPTLDFVEVGASPPAAPPWKILHEMLSNLTTRRINPKKLPPSQQTLNPKEISTTTNPKP